MTYAVFDLETGIQRALKRKATPFYGINEIVAVGYKFKDDAGPTGHYLPEQPHPAWFRLLLERSRFLVGFNIKFDILHAMADPENRIAFMRWIAGGGQLWDCQLAEYMIHGMSQENHMLSLDEVAPRYGGTLKNDAVKALWEAGVETRDIDRDLLMEYLLGTGGMQSPGYIDPEDRGDIGNTELVFLGQVAALRARGGLQSVLLNMGALVFTIEAEFNGMHIDVELGNQLQIEVKQALEDAGHRLEQYVSDLPFTFKWSSRFHLSALVFGGTIKYDVQEPMAYEDGSPVYYQKKEEHVVMLNGTTKLPSEVTEWGAVSRFAGGKSKGLPKTKQVTVPDIERGVKLRWVEKEHTLPGYTEPDNRWKSKTPGVWSTASEVIEELGVCDIPFLKDLALRATLAKDLGTYYWTEDEETGERKGMLTLVGPDGLIHHQLNMVNTVTARLSSSDPNLQNVSGKKKSQVKRVFTSRFKGGKIIQSDFSSLEVYVQAILTLCQQLIADLRKGLDMHCVRLSQKLGLTYEEVHRRYKDGDKEIEAGRKEAKEFSFQRAYGAGVKKIALSTGMSEEDIEALIAVEMARYPEVDAFYVRITQEIQRNRVPTSRFLDHPDVPGLKCQLGRSHYVTPDGKMYSYSESPSPEWIAKKPASRGGTAQSFSPTEIKNYVVQGTGGEWAKAAMWLSVRAFYQYENFGGLALLVNQVHDAEYCDADDSVALDAAALLEACMLEASNFMEWHFAWPLPVGVPTETKYGSSMMEENDLPDCHRPRVREYQAWVRKTYIADNVPTYERE